jgi:hypothetical protein
MDQGQELFRVVEGPVVEAADPWDPESRTAEIVQPGGPIWVNDADDPLTGDASRLARGLGVLRRGWLALLPPALLAAVPMHFFVGRVNDTVVAAPALSDLLGGVGLLLLPLMWVAYFTVSALPLVIGLAGVVAVAVAGAAIGTRPAPREVWRLVAYRLRPLWLWFAPAGLVTQALPVTLNAGLASSVTPPLAIGLALLSTAALTFAGLLGCVVLVERGRGPHRALHLGSLARPGGLVLASLAVAVLPPLVDSVLGGIASTVVAVLAILLWAITALLTYAQARRFEGPVTSGSLFAELAAPELD